MNRREKLRENYEEALFALLLEEKIEEDGKSLLEEKARMNSDSDEEVPEQVNKRGYKTIRRAFAKENFRLISKTVGQTIQRLSVVVFLVVTLVSTAFAISPKFRVDTLNLLIEVSDVATSLRLTNEKEPSGSTVSNKPDRAGVELLGYRFPALPDGFELLHESVSDTSATVIYENEEGQEVWFSVDTANGNTLNIDTEDADLVETISVSGFQGILVEKTYKFPDGEREQVTVVWGDIDHNYFVDVTTIGLGRAEALALAEQVVYVGTPATEEKEENSDPTISNKSDETGVNLMGYCFPNLPDGFGVVHESESFLFSKVTYMNTVGEEVSYSVRKAEGTRLSIDTEGAHNVELVGINGYDGILIEKQYAIEDLTIDSVSVYWGDTDRNVFINVVCTNLSREYALELAKQVYYQGTRPEKVPAIKDDDQAPLVGEDTPEGKEHGSELIAPNEVGVNLLGYQFPALSEKFKLTRQDISSRYSKAIFSSEEGETITFSARKVTATANYNVDTENAQNVESITINGYEGILVEKRYVFEDKTIDNVSIVWGDTDQSVFINVMCGNLSREYALELAKQVYYK